MAFKLCVGIKKDEWKNESIKSNLVLSFFKPSSFTAEKSKIYLNFTLI